MFFGANALKEAVATAQACDRRSRNVRRRLESAAKGDKVTIILTGFPTFSSLTRLEAVFPLSNGALCGILKKV
jgi:hypothetical protein